MPRGQNPLPFCIIPFSTEKVIVSYTFDRKMERKDTVSFS